MTGAEILTAIGNVHLAGAKKAAGWVYNHNAQILSETHQAMADEAFAQAAVLQEAER